MREGTEGDDEAGPVVRSMADILAHDGRRVTLRGEYRAIPVPTRGGNDPGDPLEYAVVILEDGTRVFLETFGTPEASRPPAELRRFDRRRVAARGTIHGLMPVRGEGLLEPSLGDVRSVAELPAGE
jgi:hypothetical protein